MNKSYGNDFGEVIRRQRVTIPLTLQELAAKAGVSPSHLGRIERGERFPSARILRKIAQPLGLREDELFTMAGYLSGTTTAARAKQGGYLPKRLEPYVARVLSEEPPEIQRTVVVILAVMKTMAASLSKDGGTPASA